VESKGGRICRVKYWKTALAILAAVSASLALAEDFKTIKGKEYKNARVSRVEPDGIVLIYNSGVAKVYFAELPKDVQKRLGYDTDKIEAAARAAEEKRVEEQKAAERARAEKERKTESKFESKVWVERQIEIHGEARFIFRWSMTLRLGSFAFAFYHASTEGTDPAKLMIFSDPSEATDVLAKFVEWDETAQRNNAESFRKKINGDCTFEFSHDGSTLNYYRKTASGTFSGEFTRFDIDKFNELLKQLPDAKAELEAKIVKAKKEEALFK
jgi:hypothetical protein